MATITNTVQGLNETIGLLKQILGAVQKDNKKQSESKGGEKNVQAKDISSSAVLLSKIDKKGSENIKSVILAFEPLNKMNDKLGEKAKEIANAIKVLSSKEIVEGLKSYESLSPKIIGNTFNVIDVILTQIEIISKKHNTKTIKDFSNTLKMLSKSLKEITLTMFLLSAFIVVAAMVGVIAIFAWKYILVGFTTIVATSLLLIAISFIVKKIASISEEIIVSAIRVIFIIYAMASIVIVSSLVGALAIFAWKQILIGFTTIVGVVFGILLVMSVIKVAVLGLKMLALKVGGKNFLRHLIGGANGMIMPENVRDILFVIASMALIPVVSALVGLIAINYFGLIAAGFGTISGMIFVVLGIIKILEGIKGIEKGIETAKTIAILMLTLAVVVFAIVAISLFVEKSGVGWESVLGVTTMMGLLLLGVGLLLKLVGTIKPNVKSLIAMALIIAVLVVLTLVLFAIVTLTQKVQEIGGWGEIFITLAAMAGFVFAVALLMAAIGGIMMIPYVAPAIMMGGVVILGISAVIIVLGGALFLVANLSQKIEEIGGWEKIYETISGLPLFVFGVAGLMAAIGALVANPIMPIVMAVGAATLVLISGIAVILCGVIKEIIDAGKKASELGIDKIPEIAKQMALTLTSFVTTIVTELKKVSIYNVKKIGRMMKPISNVINTCSNFMDMISSFSTEDCGPNELRSVYYDSDTGKYKKGPKSNIVAVGKMIGLSFGSFVDTITKEIEDFSGKSKKALKKLKKSGIVDIINACSSFVKMISSISSGEKGVLAIYETDSEGNFKKDSKGNYKIIRVNIDVIGGVIASSFINFAEKLVSEMDKPGQIKRRLKKLKKSGIVDVISACSSFVELISSFAGTDGNNSNVLKMLIKDENGKYKQKKNGEYITRDINMVAIGTTIANSLTGFVKSLSAGLESADVDFEDFSKHFGKITNNFDKITKSIFSIDDAKAKKLKEHTDAINKFAEAVGNVSKSIDTLNSKEIDLKLDELKEGINMKISLDGDGKINTIETEPNSGGVIGNIANKVGNLFSGSSDNKTQTTVQKIDTESISNAIVEGFKKINMLKVELNQNGGQSINLDGNLTLG